MKRPPIGVIVISALLILAGFVGLVRDLEKLKSISANHYDVVWAAGVHLLAIVAGGFMFRGHNWARWLAVAWMAFHVVLVIHTPLTILLSHIAMLLLFIWFLFLQSGARAWFGPSQTTSTSG
jgi:hypothetical protein